jgi:TonB-linked SusC/RagA family outer membrane protein
MKRKKNFNIRWDKCTLLIMFMFFCMNFQTYNVYGSQQNKKLVTGVVTDGSGIPLPGVTVTIKGTSGGTITNIDGNYELQASPTDVLIFSFMGYLTEEISVGETNQISITLTEDIIGLDEVVVTGYGVQRKSDVTGSISSISSDKITEIPVAGIDQALQGRAAGVNVINNSGRPGESASIQIRGISSINGMEPLIIVDGVEGSLDGINPGDIASIEVLKDASSTAIYGVKGGSGVIIITTRTGQSGKMQTNFNYYRGSESPVHKLDLMNSQQWLETVEERSTSTTAITSRPDTFPNYNWQNIVFEPAITENYDLSFSGGNEKSTFMISSSYNSQGGIIRNSDYHRFTLRVNSDHKMTNWLKIDEKITFVNSINSGFEASLWNQYYDGPIRPALQMAPYVPAYEADGTWANSDFGGDNPLAILDMIDRKAKRNDFEGNVGIKIDIIKGLSFSSRFDGKLNFDDTKEFQDEYYNTVEDRRVGTTLIGSMNRDNSYNTQQFLTYNTTFAEALNFSVTAGAEQYRRWGYDIAGRRDSLTSSIPEMLYFNMSYDRTRDDQIVTGGGFEERALGYFGRINTDYMGKYLLTINVRRDGRSNLGPKNRFGIFPSISGGWKFSEEKFMANQNILSFGKVRIGYGKTGAFPRSGYPYLSLVRMPNTFAYPFNNQVSSIGAAPVQIENPEIHWETINMFNIGFDLAFYNNKLTLTTEYYNKTNEGMLMLQDVPYTTGSWSAGSAFDQDNTSPEVNIGSLQNTGFEFTIGYKKMDGDLKGSFDLNISTIKNKVLELASDSMLRGAVHTVSPICLTRVGGSVSEFYGWQTDGIFRADDPVNADGVFTNQPYMIEDNGDTAYAQPTARAGDVRFVDINGDGRVLTLDDKTSLGSPLPKLIFGFSVNLEYKGFDLSAFFNGTLGNKLFNGTKQYLYYYQTNSNHSVDFANRYVENDIIKQDPYTGADVVVVHQNRDTDIPRNASANYSRPSDFYIEDASFLRLRNLTLGYTFPNSLTSKIKVEKFRLYVGARNLFTLTRYQGFNPEYGYTSDRQNLDMGVDVGVYPVTRMFLFGVNLQF